jgi:signal transduction histidine kinase
LDLIIAMDFYGRKNLWKFILLMFAFAIGAVTLWYTESFLKELREQEVRRVEQFANANRNILNAAPDADVTFEMSIISANTTVPILLTDEDGNFIEARNMNRERLQQDTLYLQKKIRDMQAVAAPIPVVFGEGQVQYLYFENSTLLTKLRYYPLILLLVIGLFMVIAYIAFSNARKAEQNQVWNGLAKETAHQIGTPLTSLMGWAEYLRSHNTDNRIVEEMEKDIQRLNTITDRFSKIGSKPALTPYPVAQVTEEAVKYLQARSPGKIEITYHTEESVKSKIARLNKPLFEWVIENLVRNAIDAIEAQGSIDVRVSETARNLVIEVEDTGKGIPANKQRSIFRPGYTTKSRGWGLGLSLAKRIIEEYHGGRIFVASSEVGKGSIFRILLRK